MRALSIALMAAAGVAICGCGRPMHPMDIGGRGYSGPTNQSRDINAIGIFGGANVTAMSLECVGRVGLTQGQATVRDGCFSGDTNIVMCTDVTAANPIRCAPSAGKLEIAGAGEDVISYARVH